MHREGLQALDCVQEEPPREERRQERRRGPQLPALGRVGQGVQEDQRVVAAGLEHVDAAARRKHPRALVDEPRGLRDVMDDVPDEQVVEAPVLERQLVRAPDDELALGQAPPGERELLFEQIDARGVVLPSEVEERRALAAPQIEHVVAQRLERAPDELALSVRHVRGLRLPAKVLGLGGPEGALEELLLDQRHVRAPSGACGTRSPSS